MSLLGRAGAWAARRGPERGVIWDRRGVPGSGRGAQGTGPAGDARVLGFLAGPRQRGLWYPSSRLGNGGRSAQVGGRKEVAC